MKLDEFIRSLDALLEEHRAERHDDPGEGNYSCEACSGCYECRFCVGCGGCEDCTYCEECVDCVSCTQCKRSLSCARSSHCEDARDCEDSRYLLLCVECRGCVHCLGCVGLEGAEFHVLNEKLTRKAYFELVRQLRAELEPRLAAGWRPEPIGLEGVELVEGVDDHGTRTRGATTFEEDELSPWSHASAEQGRAAALPPTPVARRPMRPSRGAGDAFEASPPPPGRAAPTSEPRARATDEAGLRRGRRPVRRS